MTDEQFSLALSVLKNVGVTPSVKGLTKIGPAGKPIVANNAGEILKGAGIDIAEFMDEFKKRTNNAVSMAAGTTSSEANIANNYLVKQLIHPAKATLPQWSASDMKFFGRFRFTTNPTDGSVLMFINTYGRHYTAVPFGSKLSTMIATIASVCSSSVPTNPNFANLYDELTRGYQLNLKTVTDRFRQRTIINQEDFINALSNAIPCSMLHELSIMCVVESKKTKMEIGGQQVEKEYLIPHVTELYDGLSKTDIIEFIVKHVDLLASKRDLQCPMPKVYTNDPDEMALHYIDLDSIVQEGPCPTWDGYLRRFTAAEGDVIKAFIWSIFDAKNTGRQMLYFLDPKGFSGKSVVVSVIAEALGEPLCMALQKDSLNNQFSLAKIWDKRLVTIDDNKNPRLLWSEKMHMILGHGMADIEMKGRNSFQAKMQAKVIANGNVPLEVHRDAQHEYTRLIMVQTVVTDEILKEFCAVDENGNVIRRKNGDPIPIGDSNFAENLKREFPMFLYKCREVYPRLCPKRSDIIIPDEMMDNILSNSPLEDLVLDDIADTCVEYDGVSLIKYSDFREDFFDALSFYRTGGQNATDIPTLDQYKDYLKKKYPDIKFSERKRVGNDRSRYVVGLRRKYNEAMNEYHIQEAYDPMKPNPKFKDAV